MSTLLNSTTLISRKADGTVNALGLVYTYAAGGLTPQASYTTAARNVQHTNPVVLSADGTAEIHLDPTLSYRIIEKTAADVTIRETDNYTAESYIADIASTASGKGDALIGVKLDETGTAARTQHAKNAERVTILDFSGADPTGAGDSTAAVLAFLTAASGRENILSPGTYKLTSMLNMSAIPLSDCVIRGVPGETIITGNFGYALLYLGQLTNVRFEGITFNNTYVNATEVGAPAVVYTGNTSIQDSGFWHCTFKAPSAGIQGLGIFNRTTVVDTQTCTVDGLHIEHCLFENIGSSACTIYNRQDTSDKYEAMKNIFFRHNTIRNTGLSGVYGFAVSLDGYGTGAEVSHNVLENYKRAGIENTGYNGVTIAHNTFLAGANTARAISAADPVAPDVVTGCVVIGNKCLDAQTAPSYVSRATSGYFAGNTWNYTNATLGAGPAFLVLDCEDVMVVGDRYVSDSAYAVQFQANTGDCTGNRLTECTFDTSASSAVTANVNFTGANCTNNQAFGRSLKGTGGAHWTQTTSAASNVFGNDASRNAGVYTPTLSATTNVAASTAFQCSWFRVGNVVTVTGRFDVTLTTAAGTASLLGISLPISTTFTSSEELAGTASPNNSSADKSAGIFADVVNNRASVSWQCGATAAHGMHFQFSYLLL